MTAKNKIKSVFLVVFFLYTLFFIVGGVLAPIFAHFKMFVQADILYLLFHKSCNQDALRSFWILGYQMAICARCLGVYLGTAAVLALMFFRVKVPLLLYILFAFIGFGEVLLEKLRLFGGNNYIRLAAGICLGMFIGGAIIRIVNIREREVNV